MPSFLILHEIHESFIKHVSLVPYLEGVIFKLIKYIKKRLKECSTI